MSVPPEEQSFGNLETEDPSKEDTQVAKKYMIRYYLTSMRVVTIRQKGREKKKEK